MGHGKGYLLIDLGEGAGEHHWLPAAHLLEVVVRFRRNFFKRPSAERCRSRQQASCRLSTPTAADENNKKMCDYVCSRPILIRWSGIISASPAALLMLEKRSPTVTSVATAISGVKVSSVPRSMR